MMTLAVPMITYQCPECGSVRGAEERVMTPDLSHEALLKPRSDTAAESTEGAEDTGGWYLCWCRGDSTPVRMVSVSESNPRDPESGKPVITGRDDQRAGFQTLDADLKIKRRRYTRQKHNANRRTSHKKQWTDSHVVDNGYLDDDYNPAQDQA